jgi:hypothetical protein
MAAWRERRAEARVPVAAGRPAEETPADRNAVASDDAPPPEAPPPV